MSLLVHFAILPLRRGRTFALPMIPGGTGVLTRVRPFSNNEAAHGNVISSHSEVSGRNEKIAAATGLVPVGRSLVRYPQAIAVSATAGLVPVER